MNVAIFADVHGRILLCFKLCARWERETGERIDLVLQAGDLGAFPDPARIDKATLRHAQADPTELGFSDYFVHPTAMARDVLAQCSADLVFVRGNHEDHTWLDTLERQATGSVFPVDAYQRILCLRTGMPFTFSRDGEALTILGIGRIGPPVGAGEHKATYIQPEERERIYALGDLAVDVLLTHDVARDFITPGFGLEETRLVLDQYRPLYHFYGHIERPLLRRLDPNGVTASVKLSDLTWDETDRGQPINAGAMGILRWHDRDNHAFEVAAAPWLREYTARTWLYR